VYKNYWDIIFKIDSIQDEQRKIDDLKTLQANLQQTLEEMKLNYEPLKNNSISVIALIRAVAKVRFHSIFGYLNLLFRDIFPIINDKSIKTQIEILEKNIEKLENNNK